MKFSTPIFALVATLLSYTTGAPLSKRGGLAFTNDSYQGVTVGTPLTLAWSGNDGAVTITLKSGSADNLETVGTVASGIWGTSTTFTPTTTGTCAFEISHASSTNYSPQFYVSASLARRTNLSSDLKDAALYLPRLFARGVTSLIPRARKTTEKPPALADDGVPCWAVNGDMPDICLDSKGKMYKSRTAQLTEVDSIRSHNIKHGADKSYKPSEIDARGVKSKAKNTKKEDPALDFDGTPCWAVLSGLPDICKDDKGQMYKSREEQVTEVDAIRRNNIKHGADKSYKPSEIDTRSIEPLATRPDGTPCWEIRGGIPNVCVSPEGEVYHYAREQATEVDSLRWNNLKNGADKGTEQYVKEERECEEKGVEGREWSA